MAVDDLFGESIGGDSSSSSRAEPAYTSNVNFLFHSNQMSTALKENYGLSEGDANKFINYWAEGFRGEAGRWPTVNDVDDSFRIGALGMVTALPQVFTYNGKSFFTGSGNIPREVDPRPNYILNQQFGGSFIEQPTGPELTDDDFITMLAAVRKPRGGSGRRGPVLDKNLVTEQINEGWRFYLMDEAPSDLADRFIAEHLAFARQGGSLDLGTWVLNQVRKTARYSSLYKRKPPELSEADFINRYRGVADRFGTPASTTRANIESGMSSGASVAGFQERVQNSRPVQVASGNFGRQVANLMNQMRVMK